MSWPKIIWVKVSKNRVADFSKCRSYLLTCTQATAQRPLWAPSWFLTCTDAAVGVNTACGWHFARRGTQHRCVFPFQNPKICICLHHAAAPCHCTMPLHPATAPCRCSTLAPVHFTTKITLLASNQAPNAPNSLNDISNT